MSSDVGQGNSCLAQGSDFKTDIVTVFCVVMCIFAHKVLPVCLCIAVVGTVPGLGLLILARAGFDTGP